jgi:predicted nucleic acid-binding protein
VSFLVDTNILCEPARPDPNRRVLDWIDANESDLYLSVITIGEIRRGIRLQPSQKKAAALQSWLEEILLAFDNRIIPLDLPVALKWGDYYASLQKQGHKPPVTDSLLAATALAHALTLATRNAPDFPGLDTVNPFNPPPRQ